MGFINEKVSEEDGKKYDIFDLKRKYYKKNNNREFDIKHVGGYVNWSIDREREIWFARMVICHLPDPRDGRTGEVIFILHYKNQNIELDLREINDDTTSLKLTDNPFIVKWKLEKVNNQEELIDISYEEIVEVLNEVLQAYGIGEVDRIYVPQENFQIMLEA